MLTSDSSFLELVWQQQDHIGLSHVEDRVVVVVVDNKALCAAAGDL